MKPFKVILSYLTREISPEPIRSIRLKVALKANVERTSSLTDFVLDRKAYINWIKEIAMALWFQGIYLQKTLYDVQYWG